MQKRYDNIDDIVDDLNWRNLEKQEEERRMNKKELLKWMAAQPDKILLDICKVQMKILMKVADANVASGDKITEKQMLNSLVKAINYYWLIDNKIDPETCRKIGLYEGAGEREKRKKMKVERLKSMSKRSSKKQKRIEMVGPKIVDFLSQGVSYSGIVKMLLSDHKIEVSKAWVGKIIKANEWEKIAKEGKGTKGKTEEKVLEGKMGNVKSDEIVT